jgi:hypothetical protein
MRHKNELAEASVTHFHGVWFHLKLWMPLGQIYRSVLGALCSEGDKTKNLKAKTQNLADLGE